MGRKRGKETGKLKSGCKTEYTVTVGHNVPRPTMRCLWRFWYLRKNGCDYHQVVPCLAVTGFVKSHQAQERSCNSREELYLLPAKAIKPNRKVSELDPAIFFEEEDLSQFQFHHVLGFKVIQRAFLMPVI